MCHAIAFGSEGLKCLQTISAAAINVSITPIKLSTYPISPCSKGQAQDQLDTHSGKAEVRVEVRLAVRGIPQMFLPSATLVLCLHMPELQQLWDSCRTVWDSRAHTQEPPPSTSSVKTEDVFTGLICWEVLAFKSADLSLV